MRVAILEDFAVRQNNQHPVLRALAQPELQLLMHPAGLRRFGRGGEKNIQTA